MWKEIHDEHNKHVYDDCLTQCELDQGELCGYTEIPLSSGKKLKTCNCRIILNSSNLRKLNQNKKLTSITRLEN